MKTICFVTRCHPNRPSMRRMCIDSVKSQSCDDYEHFLLWDDKTKEGYGISKANKALQKASPLNGKYIMVLDDDDILIHDEFVLDFKKFVSKDKPDIVMFKSRVSLLGILPPDELWQKQPKRGKIGSFCFAVRKELWKNYIKFWVSSGGYAKMGDYTFINKCYNNATTVYWMDKTIACTQRISRGKGESHGCKIS